MSKNINNNSRKICSRSNWLVWGGLVCAIVFSSQTFGATGKARSFDEILSAADLVVVGKCIAVVSEWRKKKIYTMATIRVDEVVKGNADNEIQVEYMGGTAMHPTLKAPIAMNVSNSVTISEGEESIFVLKNISDNRYRIIGTTNGKLPLSTDKVTGKKMVRSGIKKIQTKPSSKEGVSVIAGEQMNLQEFVEFARSRIQLEQKRSKQ